MRRADGAARATAWEKNEDTGIKSKAPAGFLSSPATLELPLN